MYTKTTPKFSRFTRIFAAALFLSVSFLAVLNVQPVQAAAATAAQIKSKAKEACKDKSDTKNRSGISPRDACEKGYIAGFSNKSKDGTCGSLLGNTKDACEEGYEAGKKAGAADRRNNSPTSTLSAAEVRTKAQDFCKDKSDTNNRAGDSPRSVCEKGFIGGYGDKTKSEACPTSLNNIREDCEEGHVAGVALAEGGPAAGTGAGAGDTCTGDDCDEEPNCENFGSTLSVVICPIIEGAGAAADYIFGTFIEGTLKNIPVGTDPEDPGFKAWQGFRLIGNILLVGALLILVFAQTVGTGGRTLDAYAVRKMAPRILLGAIGINLSIYIAIAVTDITVVVGDGIGQLLTGPFIEDGNFDFVVGNTDAVTQVLGVAAGLIGGAAAVGGIGLISLVSLALFSRLGGSSNSSGIANNLVGGFAVTAIQWIILFIVIPIALIALAILITLVLRQSALTFLIIAAPIAFACYVLPGTEKYFKMWWSWFIKLLLIYPLIALMFAMSDIMSYLIFTNNQSTGGILTGLIVTFIPLLLIPYSFKLAGGAAAAAYGAISGTGKKGFNFVKGDARDPNSLQSRVKRNASGEMVRARATVVRSNIDGKSRFGRRIGRMAARGDILSREAALNRQGIERMEQVKSTGDDRFGRALTSIPLYMGDNGEYTTAAQDAAGNARTRAMDKNGIGLRQTMGGATTNDANYDEGRRLYKTQGERQAWADYEATKVPVGNTEQYKQNFMQWTDQEGYSDDEVNGLWQGVAFSRQNERLNLKYTAFKKEADGSIARDANGNRMFAGVTDNEMNFKGTGEMGKNDNFIDDMYFKKGSYQTGQLSAEDIHRVYDVKEHLATRMGQLTSNQPLTAQQAAERENIQTRLQQISNLEDTWAGERAVPGMTDDQGTPRYSGLAGGNQGVQDAFRERAYRDATVHDTVRDPATGARVVSPAGTTSTTRVLDKFDATTGRQNRADFEV